MLTWLPNTNANADCHTFPELLDWRKSMVIETQSDFPNAFRRKATRSSSVSALWNHCVKLHILGLSTSVFPRRKSRAEYSQGRRTCNQTNEARFTRSNDLPPEQGKGMTSTMVSVDFTPKALHRPTAPSTDATTIKTPLRPNNPCTEAWPWSDGQRGTGLDHFSKRQHQVGWEAGEGEN